MDEESRKLLTIHTHKGLYIVNRLCPGVKPAAGIFQQAMDTIFAGIKGIIVYFDDILIASNSWEAHNATLNEVFRRLQQFKNADFSKMKFVTWASSSTHKDNGLIRTKLRQLRPCRHPQILLRLALTLAQSVSMPVSCQP